jgi:poly(A) polymerase
MAFSWDPVRRAFADPTNLYPLLTEMRSRLGSGSSRASRATRPAPSDIVPLEVEDLTAAEAIVLASRFPIVPTGGLRAVERWEEDESIPASWHRIVLTQVLTGRFAWRGAELMARSGYLEAVLPELAAMNHTDHSKEGHPEGNVWRHSVETLRYRKTTDLVVGLALLLHDSGKPFSHEEGPRKFNHHADIGADVAHAILTRLAFPSALVERVVWLVRYHMIPGALERLPDHRRAPIMGSELFPLLLEVYRCDLSSTYRGPDGYYRACTVYRRFLKRERSRETVGIPARRLRELYVE